MVECTGLDWLYDTETRWKQKGSGKGEECRKCWS